MENLELVSTEPGLPLESAPIFGKTEPIPADASDRVFAGITFLLGYGFIETFWSDAIQWKLKVFTMVYLCVVASYFYVKKKQMPRETYFWLGVVGILGLSYSEQGMIFPMIQILALILAAAYLVLCAGGNLLKEQKSSQWILVDGWNAIIVVPFGNFFCNIRVLFSGDKENEKDAPHPVRAVILGLVITIPLLAFILPLLGQADAHFAEILRGLGQYVQEDIMGTLIKFLLSIPVTAYLFGLFYGSLHQRKTDHFSDKTMNDAMEHSRIVPTLAFLTLLMVVCFVYLVFIGLQGSYLFSAFAGIRPESFTYAEYARQGFFELCKVSVLNLTILVVGNTVSRRGAQCDMALRLMNVLLSGLTVLLIMTAMSKMMLYISEYGLTVKRVDTMVFMVWLLITFGLTIRNQFRKLPLVRMSLFMGTIMYTVLCVLPVSWVINS